MARPHSLAVKAERRNGPDRFTLYVNPVAAGPEPSSGTVKDDVDLAMITAICLYSTGAFSFDELRIGGTWAEVTGAR